MGPRLPLRRILFLRPFRPPNPPRTFTHNTLLARSRPQLPFLTSGSRRPIARFITTETKQWIKSEVGKAIKWTLMGWTAVGCVLVLSFGVMQEWEERNFPTPREWSWVSRKDARGTRFNEARQDEPNYVIDWVYCAGTYLRTLNRLENPEIDGAGLVERTEEPVLRGEKWLRESPLLNAHDKCQRVDVDDYRNFPWLHPKKTTIEGRDGKMGWDITGKSEAWRRGYHEVLLATARGAEHVDGYVWDRVRRVFFPPEAVKGPSNPRPRPMPPGAPTGPREEDCDPGFDEPDIFYVRALTTIGFTEKQRVDAALAYAEWLAYKNTPDAAVEACKSALHIATENCPAAVDTNTGLLNPKITAPTENVLAATTALAVHQARSGNLNAALPIFLSVLRAHKSLPEPPRTMLSEFVPVEEEHGTWAMISNFVKSIMVVPSYPPPPPDGTEPSSRGTKQRCEEAGVMAYIGEILYASKNTKSSKEDGLAWTREAVDIAEEELRVRPQKMSKIAKKVCQECLRTGLGNWETMVAVLVKTERENPAKKAASTGWLGFGGEKEVELVRRWESEEKVVKERVRRAVDVLPVQNKLEPGGFSFV